MKLFAFLVFLAALFLLAPYFLASAPTPPVGCRNAAAVECGKRS